MSRQIALQTLSEALRHTKRVLNAHQGMEGEKRLQRVLGGQARRYPNQGISGRQEPRQPLQSPLRNRQPRGW